MKAPVVHWGAIRPAWWDSAVLVSKAACSPYLHNASVHPDRTRTTCKRCKRIPSQSRDFSPYRDKGNVE